MRVRCDHCKMALMILRALIGGSRSGATDHDDGRSSIGLACLPQDGVCPKINLEIAFVALLVNGSI